MIRRDNGNGMSCIAARQAGFSLIELMVVVAVIGILASIALPSYNAYLIKSRRAAGAACLTAAAQQMERFYTTELTYSGAPAAFPCDAETAPYYTVTGVVGGTGRTYTLSASPQGKQDADTECGTLTIDQAGAKTPATASCW